jgi:CheY-like chemotaxis protein
MSRPDILLVDDEPDILEFGVAFLRAAGYQPLSAVSGDVALILLEQGLPFELLITDVMMPGTLDGFALARHALAFRPNLRVIYTTGFSSAANVRARGAPFGDVLTKPWQVADFMAAVRRAMQGGGETNGLTRTG